MKKLLLIAFTFPTVFSFSQPKISFKDTICRVDTIAFASNVRFKFTFWNSGNKPLIIEDVKGNFPSNFSSKPIQPGDTGIVELFMNTERAGTFNKAEFLKCNDPMHPYITVWVTGYVTPQSKIQGIKNIKSFENTNPKIIGINYPTPHNEKELKELNSFYDSLKIKRSANQCCYCFEKIDGTAFQTSDSILKRIREKKFFFSDTVHYYIAYAGPIIEGDCKRPTIILNSMMISFRNNASEERAKEIIDSLKLDYEKFEHLPNRPYYIITLNSNIGLEIINVINQLATIPEINYISPDTSTNPIADK